MLAASLGADSPSEEPAPSLDLVFGFSRRQEHWHWLGVAVLAGDGSPRIKGNGAKLGKKALRRLATSPGKKQVTAGKAVAHIDRCLKSGTDPSEIDFSQIQGLSSWEGAALRYALVLLTGSSQLKPTYESASGAHANSRQLPTLWFGIPVHSVRTNGPDLPLEDLYDEPALIRVPNNDESGEKGPDAVTGSPIYEQWLAESCHTVHLAGALLPGTQRTFARGEVLSLVCALAATWSDREATEAIRLCALAYALSLLTGSSRRSVVSAMARLALRPQDQNENWLSAEAFRVRIPHHQAFGKPVPRSQPSLLPTSTEFWLPLPSLIRSALADLGKFGPTISSLTEHGWNAHFELLKQRLEGAAPRFSEARLRHVMPVAIWINSGDTVRTQMISGQLLDHPSAALHYYAFSVRELVQSYLAGIKSWLPDDWGVASPSFGEADEALIGAPNAAICDDALRSAVAALLQSDQRRAKSLDDLVDSYNRLVGITVAMFAAATAHRLTYHLGMLRLGDFILDLPVPRSPGDTADSSTSCALTIFADKLTDNGLVYRVAAVPPMLKKQILELMAAIRNLRGAFASSLYGRRSAESLARIEAGQASLFQVIDRQHRKGQAAAYRVRRFRRRDLRILWPELQIPVEHLRHRFTTIARRNGLVPDDLRRQMGHSIEAVPFGSTDPDSAMEFVRRASGPIEAALRGDGWETIRLNAREDSVPAVPSSSCAEVLHIEEAILGHAARRWARFRHLIGTQRNQRRPEVVAIIDQLTSRSEGEGAGSEPQSVQSSSKRDRIATQLAKSCSEPVMQPEMSKILRTWARSQKRSGRWNAPLPSMSFRKRVEPPLITPAATRAYATASRLLSFAESQDLTSGKDAKSVTSEMLVLAVIELSIRGGLTSADRLLRCIRALGNAQQYGTNSDQVVVPLGEVLQINEASGIQPATSGDKHEAAEGFLLTGVLALLSLGWRSRGIDASSVTAQDLLDACADRVPKTILGDVHPELSALDTVLHVAALARRLTQPGLRSAWEEGRIASRSLDCARASELRSSDWLGPIVVVPEDVRPSSGGTGPNVKVATGDAAFLRWMRGFVHERIRQKGGAMSHSRIADAIEKKLTGAGGCSGTASVLVRVVVQWLRRPESRKQLRLRSIYTYLVAILEPMLRQIGSNDLVRLDAESLEDIVTRIVLSARVKNRERVLRVMQEVLAEVETLGGARLEEAAIADLLPTFVAPAFPYLITAKEHDNARVQLQHWKEGAANRFVEASSDRMNLQDCAGALRLLPCSRYGLRAGEGMSRRREDFIATPDGLTLLVRPRRSNPLKTLSSSRAIDLLDLCPEETLEYQRWLSAGHDGNCRRHADRRSLVTPGGLELGNEDAIRLTRAALSIAVRGDGSRYHAGRHAISCSALVNIMPQHFGVHSYRALGVPPFLAQLSALPSSIQLQAVARVLGQATPLTTLTHYAHLIGYLEGSDRGWPLPMTQGLSAIALIRHGALRTMLSRAKIKARNATPHSLIDLLGIQAPSVPLPNGSREFVPSLSLPTALRSKKSVGSYQLIGELLIGIASGDSVQAVMSEYGLSDEYFDVVVNETLVLQEQYRYQLLLRNRLGVVESAGRIPRINGVKDILKRCDLQAAEFPQDWEFFANALESQTRLDGSVLITTSHRQECVSKTMGVILGKEVITSKLQDGRLRLDHDVKVEAGAVRGRKRSVIAFSFFVVLLVRRLRDRHQPVVAPSPPLAVA
ncbi:MAG: hypothetical protein ACT4QA_07980 [Panacagrimonas sp.]